MFCVQSLPPSIGLLDPTIAELPAWNKLLIGHPVVTWPTFCEYVRTKVNMLATEDHLRELICQLHLVGEVGGGVGRLALSHYLGNFIFPDCAIYRASHTKNDPLGFFKYFGQQYKFQNHILLA